MNLQKDPIMLFSFINTQLRDSFSSLEDLAKSYGVSETDIKETLSKAGYYYDSENNRFVAGT
jgi:biotin operon repressor